MNEIQKYIAANEPKIMEDLFSLIRIPSISALPEHHDDMLACAQRWAQLLLEAGADEALVMPSKGNPIVFAQKIVDPNAKTVLVYAHYGKASHSSPKYGTGTFGRAARTMTRDNPLFRSKPLNISPRTNF